MNKLETQHQKNNGDETYKYTTYNACILILIFLEVIIVLIISSLIDFMFYHLHSSLWKYTMFFYDSFHALPNILNITFPTETHRFIVNFSEKNSLTRKGMHYLLLLLSLQLWHKHQRGTYSLGTPEWNIMWTIFQSIYFNGITFNKFRFAEFN